MKVEIVRIGNSKGIRIPKPVIEQCGFGDSVELEVLEGKVVLSPAREARSGWDEAFAAMAEHGDDVPLLDDVPTSWDDAEWQW